MPESKKRTAPTAVRKYEARKDTKLDAPTGSFYTEEQKAELLADVRGLLHECPWLKDRDAETVRRMLITLRGVAVSAFEVGLALEALTVDDEVLA